MERLVGTGIDITSVERFRRLHHPQRVAELYLSPAETRAYAEALDPALFLASRFAAKEAVIKASPLSVRAIDFEIVEENIRPSVEWRASVPYVFSLSLSRERDYACAVALCLSST